MMTVTLQEEPKPKATENSSSSDSRFLSDSQHQKVLIRNFQRQIEAFKEMKENEKQDRITQGRRRWFNKQIKGLREEIRNIEEESEDQ